MPSVDDTCEYVFDPEDPETWGGEEDNGCYVSEKVLNEDDVWTCPHEVEQGEDLCIFHLPVERKDDEEVVDVLLQTLEIAVSINDLHMQRRKGQFIGARFGSINLKEIEEIGSSDLIINLKHVQFAGEVELHDVAIMCSVSFDGAKFHRTVDFKDSTFQNFVSLRAVFEQGINCQGTIFCESAHFQNATFFDPIANYEDATFEGNAIFGQARFACRANFDNATFSESHGEWPDFDNSEFEDLVQFMNVAYEDDFTTDNQFSELRERASNDLNSLMHTISPDPNIAEFEKVTFEQYTTFGNAIFECEANFEAVTFHGMSFKDTIFNGNGNFEETVFKDKARFWRTIFNGNGNFEETVFKDEAFLSDATFNSEAVFKNTTFGKEVKFSSADFKEAQFISATFKQEAHFNGTTFRYAIFYDITFENEAILEGTSFMSWSAFIDTTFKGGANFTNAVFSEVVFTNVVFHDTAVFRRDYSKKIFPISVFDGPAEFSNVTARGSIDFRVTYGDRILSREMVTFTDKADFTGSSLTSGCNFEGVTFGRPPTFTDANLEKADCSGANLDGADFSNTNLTDVTFRNTSLQGADLETARLSRTNLTGADLRGAALSEAVLTDARINDTTRFLQPPVDDLSVGARLPWLVATFLPSVTPIIPACGYDSDFTPPEGVNDIEWPERSLYKAKGVYRAIENLAGLSSRPRLQHRAFIRRQDIHRKQHIQKAGTTDGLNKIANRSSAARASVARWILLYGESPWRIIGWSLGTIFGFSLLYPFGGWIKPEDGDPITYSEINTDLSALSDIVSVSSNFLDILGDSLYYSTLTFTALGFGDFRPVGLGRMLTTVETGFGAVLLALLVFILGRRAAR